ncbi:hypothetical protein PRIPAC_84714 [Pristionchus pacificus]|uniref:Uncharacterized protein n=1 Tax=Pristionchus pacificus TaxID=54126 RepID=A0A2A6BK62_PRIPA|nr:hypothetical protein PRIPAC_84714 [Pristionchus pacificus]|eukprot:PDM66289.1 hypothetical protein PRIPAC_47706 [Pristionchus pacificus]
MSNPLKRSNEDAKSIAKTMKLLEEDHLPQIFDDCLLDILSRLDHDDLDELSTVSSKMRTLSVLSRSKAVKVPAKELSILQATNAQIVIELCFPREDVFIDRLRGL